MNNNLFEILKATDYYIEYRNFSNESRAEVYISWYDETFTFQYDHKKKKFFSKELEMSVTCEKCSVKAIMYLTLKSIIKECKYPYQLVFFKINNNVTNAFYFELPNLNEKEMDTIMSLQYIIEDFNNGGLTQEHFTMLVENNMLPYMNDILRAKYNLELLECRDE